MKFSIHQRLGRVRREKEQVREEKKTGVSPDYYLFDIAGI